MDDSPPDALSTSIQLRKASRPTSRPLGVRHSYSVTDIPKATLGVDSQRREGIFTGQRIQATGIPDSPTSSSSEGGLNGDIVTDGHTIPVRLEKISGKHGRTHYMLNVKGDIRELLVELEKEQRRYLATGKKWTRRKRFSDVWYAPSPRLICLNSLFTGSWFSPSDSRLLTDSIPTLANHHSMVFIHFSGLIHTMKSY